MNVGLSYELELAHVQAVSAASAGLQDAALGALRLTGAGVAVLADAAVTSATPFLRAPLLGKLSAALLLHPSIGHENRWCATCNTAAPCKTSETLSW